ncbi:hypothetical protein ACGFT2_11600 [Streptomyces sp. NPDC048514]|uniref:hypothetical protein n=1 Tax=Streptomyces sp. NPDC048514 TaxID=3365564 RepID=UPI003715368E
MIKKIPHQSTGRGPADINLAVSIASELHRHIPAPRAPEVARTPVPEMMGLRTSAARPHRRKVPLKRLNTMRSLTALGV